MVSKASGELKIKNGIDALDGAFSAYKDRLVPVGLNRKPNGKKDTRFPKGWDGVVFNDDDFSGYNSVAFRTGNGIGGIDVDTKDLDSIKGYLGTWIRERMEKRDTLIVESLNGYHFYVDVGDFRLKTSTKTGANKSKIPDVDFRGEGGLLFCASTNKKGFPYRVLSDVEPIKVNEKLLATLPSKDKEAIKGDNDLGDLTMDDFYAPMKLKSVKEHLKVCDAGADRTNWMEIMASVYNSVKDKEKAFELCLKWSKTAKGVYEDEGFAQVWKQLEDGTYGVGIGSSKLIRSALDDKTKKIISKLDKCESIEELNRCFSSKGWLKQPHIYANELVGSIAEAYVRRAKELKKTVAIEDATRMIKESFDEPADEELNGKVYTPEIAKKIFGIEMDDTPIEPIDIGLDKPLIFKGRLHMIFGVYGTNKSALSVVLAGRTAKKAGMTAIYHDGELNGGDIRKLCEENGVAYVPSDISSNKMDLLLKHEIDCKNVIIILDSFSAMLGEDASNNDAKDTTSTMKKAFRLSRERGATVVIIEHATPQTYGKDGEPEPFSAKMEGSQSGKSKLCDFVYKTVPISRDYRDGTNLFVVKSRKPDIIGKGYMVKVPYEDEFEDLTGDEKGW